MQLQRFLSDNIYRQKYEGYKLTPLHSQLCLYQVYHTFYTRNKKRIADPSGRAV